MRRRRKNSTPEIENEPIDEPTESPGDDEGDFRSAGPWDSTQKDVEDDPTYIDLGSMIVRCRTGIRIQLPTDGNTEQTGAVVMLTEDAALELRAFAARRSGGLWAEVREDLLADVERLVGEAESVDGVFGPEIRVRIPVTLPDGEAGIQPSRVIGVEGPRWLLRATFLGKAALEPSDEGLLMECFRDTIVRRGSAPMAPREALVLTVPHRPVAPNDED